MNITRQIRFPLSVPLLARQAVRRKVDSPRFRAFIAGRSRRRWKSLASVVFAIWLVLASLGGQALNNRAAAAEAPVAKSQGAATPQETWDAFYMAGAKIGYGQTTVRPVTRGGKQLLQIEAVTRLSIARFGRRVEQNLKTSSLETPDGQMIEFKTEATLGPTPVTVVGHVEGDQMLIETSSKGVKKADRIPWSNDIGGFRAVEQSLETSPLAPGQKRKLKMLMPLLNQIAEVELAAADYETVSVLGVQTKLLHVNASSKTPDGSVINSTMWIDRAGQAIKTSIAAFKQDSFRTSRTAAIADDPQGAKFDLGADLIVKLDKALPRSSAPASCVIACNSPPPIRRKCLPTA